MQPAQAIERSTLLDFQQNPDEYIHRLKQTRQPIELTVNGNAELVLLDTESFQKLLDAIDYAESVEAIRQGLEDVEQGRTRPAKEFFEEMREQFNIPAKP